MFPSFVRVITLSYHEVNWKNYANQPPHFKNKPKYLIFPGIADIFTAKIEISTI